MFAVALLAGFFAAHAVWSVSDGETLVPIYAYVDSAGKQHMDRLAGDKLEVSVNIGRKRLSENPDHAQCAVLIFDGFVPLGNAKSDALILEARDYAAPQTITMAIPYAPKSKASAFRVYRPKLLQLPGSVDAQAFIEYFWKGVDEHPQGASVWNSHIDQSR